MTRAPCPDEEALVLYLDGALDARAEAGIRRHIGTCGICRSVIADLVRGEPAVPHERPEGGTLAGKFELLEQIGEGGMGRVYRARHLGLDRDVAIKFLRADLVQDPSMVRRFEREARAAAALYHENVVQILDISWLPSGAPFIVMEYLEGTDLSRRLRARGPFPIEEAVGYVREACAAVGAAHARGIVHRDLKPDNMFLVGDQAGRRRIKVLDFGLAKMRRPANESMTTEMSHIQGSPYFMAPEQIVGASAGPAADIWSLGATLYTLIVGEVPFLGPTLYVLMDRVLHAEAAPMGARRPAVPRALDDAIARCLRKSPGERWPTVEALDEALDGAVSVAPTSAPTAPFRKAAPGKDAIEAEEAPTETMETTVQEEDGPTRRVR